MDDPMPAGSLDEGPFEPEPDQPPFLTGRCVQCAAPAAPTSRLCTPCSAGDLYEAEQQATRAARARAARARAIAAAAELLASPSDICVLDTETTGIPHVLPGRRRRAQPRTWLAGGRIVPHTYADPAWIVDLGVIDGTGRVLCHTLIRPPTPIPAEVTRVHGIDDAMVADAPTFADVFADLQAALRGRTCLIWNANFDTAVLNCELLRLHGGNEAVDDLSRWWADLDTRVECAMHLADDYRGLWDSYRQDWAYTRLANPNPDAHRAVSDCRATLSVLTELAAGTWNPPQSTPAPRHRRSA